MVAGERDRPDVARRRAQWIKYQDRVDPARLVFIDETWTRTNMAPLRGWAPQGSRLIGKVPHGRWHTLTFLAALRHDRITAPWLLEGPIDGDSFATYVEKVLLPTLRPYPRRGSRHYRDAVYAVTHVVYTLNDYNRVRIPAHRLRRERAFLRSSIAWAIEQAEPDTVGEIVDSLAGCSVADSHPLMVRGREFLLAQQQADGGWGDEHDDYGRFHSVWTCIDGLRDYRWQRARR